MIIFPLSTRNSSLAVLPVKLAKLNPAPNSIPFTPPIENTALLITPSTLVNHGSPSPIGKLIIAV